MVQGARAAPPARESLDDRRLRELVRGSPWFPAHRETDQGDRSSAPARVRGRAGSPPDGNAHPARARNAQPLSRLAGGTVSHGRHGIERKKGRQDAASLRAATKEPARAARVAPPGLSPAQAAVTDSGARNPAPATSFQILDGMGLWAMAGRWSSAVVMLWAIALLSACAGSPPPPPKDLPATPPVDPAGEPRRPRIRVLEADASRPALSMHAEVLRAARRQAAPIGCPPKDPAPAAGRA